MIEIDIPVPPMLLDAIGYPGQARFVAVYFGAGDEAYHDDGRVSATGDPHAYIAFVRHPACMALVPFDFGSSDDPAEHWLVIDRQQELAYVAPVHEARRFLREQWYEAAATRPLVLSPDEWSELVQRIESELRSRPTPTSEHIGAALAEQHRLHRELVAWLDATAQAEQGREEIRKLVEGERPASDKGEETR